MKKNVFVVAPHPDDETLGLGGAIAKYVDQGHKVRVLTVSGHLPPLYPYESFSKTVEEAKEAYKVLGVDDFKFLEIPATKVGELPVSELNSMIAGVLNDFEPDIVFAPFPDRHVDHKVVFESVMVVTRPVGVGKKIEMVACYETLSETHWNAAHIEPCFTPNWVIDIGNYFEVKMEALEKYESQIPEFPGARSLDAVEALAKFRGTQAGFSHGEGLHIIRMKS